MPLYLTLSLILISFILFVIGVFYLMVRYKRILLGVCFGFVFIGFLIYTACYLSSGEGFANTLLAALRGMLSTVRMLLMNNEYAVLMNLQGAEWLTENIWMQILFWICHIAALIIVQAALFSLFGQEILNKFRLRFGSHREVHIIKGSDKNALILGENISTHDDPQCSPDVKRLVIFLLGEDDDTKKVQENISHFGGIVQVLNRNHDLLYCLKKAGLGERNGRKYNIILPSDNVSTLDDAHRIATFAKENNVNQENVDIFVLTSSEWDREKVEKITQAREGGQRQYPYTFHVINEVDFLIQQMIRKHPPFECPGLHFSNGVAARDFTVMICGFGIVGQSALLRLIMNGQFVGSHMRAIIIDKHIDELRGSFLHRYPDLGLCCEMEFKNLDVQSEEFFNVLNEYSNVDYIVVTLHNDEINKQTALDLRLHYERRDIHTVPFIAVSEKNGSLIEAKKDEKVFIFGCREEIYKESVIIREESNLMAKAVHEVYGGEPPWHELDWFTQESNRAAADFIPAMLMLADITKEDAMNSDTLTKDSTLTEILAQTEKLRWNAFHAAMGFRSLSVKEMQDRFDVFDGERNSRQHLDFARRDSNARLHVCLASWDELDSISEAYRELAHRAGNTKEEKRNFKDTDRDIVGSIPKFLKVAKGGE